jgi:hypothetical protein
MVFGVFSAAGLFSLFSLALHKDWLALGAALLGSLLPDIDTPKSSLGRLLPFLSIPIERRWGHRTLTHSLLLVAGLGLVCLPLYFLHRQGGFSTQALEGLSLEWEEARLHWLEAQTELNHCVLTAPVNGMVVECTLQKGARIAAGTRAFRLIDPVDLKAVLFIPADRMPGIRSGQAVTAQAEALGVSLPGQLIRVSPLVDPTSGTCRVEAHFVGGGRLVRPGTLVQIHFSDNPSPAQGEGTP